MRKDEGSDSSGSDKTDSSSAESVRLQQEGAKSPGDRAPKSPRSPSEGVCHLRPCPQVSLPSIRRARIAAPEATQYTLAPPPRGALQNPKRGLRGPHVKSGTNPHGPRTEAPRPRPQRAEPCMGRRPTGLHGAQGVFHVTSAISSPQTRHAGQVSKGHQIGGQPSREVAAPSYNFVCLAAE